MRNMASFPQAKAIDSPIETAILTNTFQTGTMRVAFHPKVRTDEGLTMIAQETRVVQPLLYWLSNEHRASSAIAEADPRWKSYIPEGGEHLAMELYGGGFMLSLDGTESPELREYCEEHGACYLG